MDQWNRSKHLEIVPRTCGILLYEKKCQIIGERMDCLLNGVGMTEQLFGKKIKLYPFLLPVNKK